MRFILAAMPFLLAPATTALADPPSDAGRPDNATTAERAVFEALQKPVDFSAIETPLEDVAAHFEKKTGVPFQLDVRALEDVGVGQDTPLTCQFRKLPAESILYFLLRELELTYVIRPGGAMITTPEAATATLQVRFYDIGDLVGEDGLRFDQLADLIRRVVEPTMWRDAGGPATLGRFRHGGIDVLVVSQHQAAHAEIHRLLSGLRRLRHPKLPEKAKTFADLGVKPPQTSAGADVTLPERQRSKAIYKALSEKTTFEFIETPLHDVVDYLEELHRINIWIDSRAMQDVGIGSDTPITRNLSGITLRSALRLTLAELDLTFYADHGVLVITTPEEAERPDTGHITRLYNVVDLIWAADADGTLRADERDFASFLISAVGRQTSWGEFGGPGAIHAIATPQLSLIAVSHTEEMHDEMEAFLSKLREHRDNKGRLPRHVTHGGSPSGMTWSGGMF